MEGEEKEDDRQYRKGDLIKEAREFNGKEMPKLLRIFNIRHYHRRIFAATSGIEKAKYQNRKYRADGADGHKTKAVVLRAAVAAGGSHANAERHDKRYSHRPGGDAS